jgi:hypothetical protein
VRSCYASAFNDCIGKHVTAVHSTSTLLYTALTLLCDSPLRQRVHRLQQPAWGPREDPLVKLALAATWHRLGRGSAQEGQDHSALDALRDDAGACVWRVAASWSSGAAASAAAASSGAASEGLAKGGRALLEAYVAAQVCVTSAQLLE